MPRLLPSRRALRLALANPVEGLDRIRARIDSWRDHRKYGGLYAASDGGFRPREEVAQIARERFGYGVEPDLERRLHDLLDAPWPCPHHAEFAAVWRDLEDTIGSGDRSAGSGLDADPALARTLYCVVRHLQPQRIVETGVSRGITSRFLLEALEANGDGGLWSIDLPPQTDEWREKAGSAVVDRLRHRWTFLRGSSRRLLPQLLRDLDQVDVFIHDSQHTEANMRFEMRLAWPRLRPGGVLVADDAHENAAWAQITRDVSGTVLMGQEERKAGLFGIALKADGSGAPAE